MRVLAAAVALTLASASAASAATIDPFNVLQHVNGVIFGGAVGTATNQRSKTSTTADVQGQLIVGGDYNGASMYDHPPATPYAGYGALTVYGKTTGNGININNGGSAYVAGAHNAQINFNADSHGNKGAYLSSAPNTIDDFETALMGYSTSLSQLTGNSTLPSAGNNEVIVAHPNGSGVAIFNITTSQLSQIPSYSINLNGASSVLFNVSGSTLDWSANLQTSNADLLGKSIVWNFYQASNVTFETQVAGTILAPLASVINKNQIDGTLVARSWTGQGELHDDLFSGRNFLATPEPGTWAMLMMGVGAIGGVLRRQRQRAAVPTV